MSRIACLEQDWSFVVHLSCAPRPNRVDLIPCRAGRFDFARIGASDLSAASGGAPWMNSIRGKYSDFHHLSAAFCPCLASVADKAAGRGLGLQAARLVR